MATPPITPEISDKMRDGTTSHDSGRSSSEPLLTRRQAEEMMRWIVSETRSIFLRALPGEYSKTNHNPAYTPDLDVATLDGYCGFAQSFIDLMLRDYGLDSKPVALQTLPGEGFGHVVLASEMETTEGKRLYLFDPTFKQFCKRRDGEPGQILAHMVDGERLVGRLLKDGFVELDPITATAYLSAFNKGIPPFKTDKEALAFFADPPPAL